MEKATGRRKGERERREREGRRLKGKVQLMGEKLPKASEFDCIFNFSITWWLSLIHI